MSARNMCVVVGVTPRITPLPSPRESQETSSCVSARGKSNASTPRLSKTFGEDQGILLPNSVVPMQLPFEVNSMSPEDQTTLLAVLEERDRNFMAARQLLMDHALAAKEAETLANAKGDKLTQQEAELIAKKHDEMVEAIVHELNTMELGYEKIIQDIQAKEMMRQLKISLEAKCHDLRERLVQQGEPPLLRDLQQVLDKHLQQVRDLHNRERIPDSACGSTEIQTPPSSEYQTLSVNGTPRDEVQTPRMKNQYLITSNEMSDHESAASSQASTPRPLLPSSRGEEDKTAAQMMKQLKASLEKKRSKLQRDLSVKNDVASSPQTKGTTLLELRIAPGTTLPELRIGEMCSMRNGEMCSKLHFHPEMRSQHVELHDLSVDLDPPGILPTPTVSGLLKSYYQASGHQQKLNLQQGLTGIDVELDQLAKDLDSVQAMATEEVFFDAPVMPKETLIHTNRGC